MSLRVEVIEDGEVVLYLIDRIRVEEDVGVICPDPEGDFLRWEEVDEAMRPGRWWRVVAPDGSLWSETSNEQEARDSMRPGDKLYRGWTVTLNEWREARWTVSDLTYTRPIARCHQRVVPVVDAVGQPIRDGDQVRERHLGDEGTVIHLFDFGDYKPPEIEWQIERPMVERPIRVCDARLTGGCWKIDDLVVISP